MNTHSQIRWDSVEAYRPDLFRAIAATQHRATHQRPSRVSPSRRSAWVSTIAALVTSLFVYALIVGAMLVTP